MRTLLFDRRRSPNSIRSTRHPTQNEVSTHISVHPNVNILHFLQATISDLTPSMTATSSPTSSASASSIATSTATFTSVEPTAFASFPPPSPPPYAGQAPAVVLFDTTFSFTGHTNATFDAATGALTGFQPAAWMAYKRRSDGTSSSSPAGFPLSFASWTGNNASATIAALAPEVWLAPDSPLAPFNPMDTPSNQSVVAFDVVIHLWPADSATGAPVIDRTGSVPALAGMRMHATLTSSDFPSPSTSSSGTGNVTASLNMMKAAFDYPSIPLQVQWLPQSPGVAAVWGNWTIVNHASANSGAWFLSFELQDPTPGAQVGVFQPFTAYFGMTSSADSAVGPADGSSPLFVLGGRSLQLTRNASTGASQWSASPTGGNVRMMAAGCIGGGPCEYPWMFPRDDNGNSGGGNTNGGGTGGCDPSTNYCYSPPPVPTVCPSLALAATLTGMAGSSGPIASDTAVLPPSYAAAFSSSSCPSFAYIPGYYYPSPSDGSAYTPPFDGSHKQLVALDLGPQFKYEGQGLLHIDTCSDVSGGGSSSSSSSSVDTVLHVGSVFDCGYPPLDPMGSSGSNSSTNSSSGSGGFASLRRRLQFDYQPNVRMYCQAYNDDASSSASIISGGSSSNASCPGGGSRIEYRPYDRIVYIVIQRKSAANSSSSSGNSSVALSPVTLRWKYVSLASALLDNTCYGSCGTYAYWNGTASVWSADSWTLWNSVGMTPPLSQPIGYPLELHQPQSYNYQPQQQIGTAPSEPLYVQLTNLTAEFAVVTEPRNATATFTVVATLTDADAMTGLPLFSSPVRAQARMSVWARTTDNPTFSYVSIPLSSQLSSNITSSGAPAGISSVSISGSWTLDSISSSYPPSGRYFLSLSIQPNVSSTVPFRVSVGLTERGSIYVPYEQWQGGVGIPSNRSWAQSGYALPVGTPDDRVWAPQGDSGNLRLMVTGCTGRTPCVALPPPPSFRPEPSPEPSATPSVVASVGFTGTPSALPSASSTHAASVTASVGVSVQLMASTTSSGSVTSTATHSSPPTRSVSPTASFTGTSSYTSTASRSPATRAIIGSLDPIPYLLMPSQWLDRKGAGLNLYRQVWLPEGYRAEDSGTFAQLSFYFPFSPPMGSSVQMTALWSPGTPPALQKLMTSSLQWLLFSANSSATTLTSSGLLTFGREEKVMTLRLGYARDFVATGNWTYPVANITGTPIDVDRPVILPTLSVSVIEADWTGVNVTNKDGFPITSAGASAGTGTNRAVLLSETAGMVPDRSTSSIVYLSLT